VRAAVPIAVPNALRDRACRGSGRRPRHCHSTLEARFSSRAMSELRFPCPCCGYPTLSEQPPGTFDICEVCGWEDDDLQYRKPSYEGGANGISLRQARANFEAIGSSDPSHRDRLRSPTDEEARNRVRHDDMS
jgi:hypothetical protein